MFDFDDAAWRPVAAGLTECRRELQFMAPLISNTADHAESGHMRIQLNSIAVPHRKLSRLYMDRAYSTALPTRQMPALLAHIRNIRRYRWDGPCLQQTNHQHRFRESRRTRVAWSGPRGYRRAAGANPYPTEGWDLWPGHRSKRSREAHRMRLRNRRAATNHRAGMKGSLGYHRPLRVDTLVTLDI
jgi:hypothetical protein